MFAVEAGPFGWAYIIYDVDSEKTILVQSDWEFPSLARSMGWIPCPCGKTDGTVDCPHRKASEMIEDAQAWIDEHLGDVFPDPGYFA